MKKIFIFLVLFYRVFLSLHFGGACRFKPTCSVYAKKALIHYPFGKALLLIFKRLSKCHFFSSFGPDPLPLTNLK